MKSNKQRRIFILYLSWILVTCMVGILAGIAIAPRFIEPTRIVVTELIVYELAVTQIVSGPTYTPYPTYTPWPTLQTGQPTPTRTITPLTPYAPKILPVEIKTPTPTPITFELVFLSWSVYLDQIAYAKIRTIPEAACTITYTTPDGQVSKTYGLNPTKPDENGECAWSWRIDSRTQPGAGIVTISANGATKNYYIQVLKP